MARGCARPVRPAREAAAGPRGTTALDRFSQDLTAKAASGEMDPILGRDEEIRQIIDVLMRRRQNNPILTGEAGVGKTAVAEGFAQRVAAGDVPPPLRGVKVCALDIGLMQAGASMKGEFEQRLRSVIDEVQNSPTPIILFIDEAHTLIGAGGAAGTGDAANLLKPALARGTLRTIAATTWLGIPAVFREGPGADPPLPTDPDRRARCMRCCDMLRGILGPMEKHHNVRISDAAIVAAVELSTPLYSGAAAAGQGGQPARHRRGAGRDQSVRDPGTIEDVTVRPLRRARQEKAALTSDCDLGAADEERIAEIETEIAEMREKLAALEAEWETEQTLVDRDPQPSRHPGRAGDRAMPPRPTGGDSARARGSQKSDEKFDALESRRSRKPHDLRPCRRVSRSPRSYPTGPAFRSAAWSRTRSRTSCACRTSSIAVSSASPMGWQMIAKRIETNRAKLDNPNKPIGVFMLPGPPASARPRPRSRWRKRFMAAKQNIITINMSEFQEAHTVSTLKGAPPGYVGYGEGGRLTEAVRRKPLQRHPARRGRKGAPRCARDLLPGLR